MPALGEDQEEECAVVVAGLRRAPLDSVGVLSRPGVCVSVCVCVWKGAGPVEHER